MKSHKALPVYVSHWHVQRRFSKTSIKGDLIIRHLEVNMRFSKKTNQFLYLFIFLMKTLNNIYLSFKQSLIV